MKKEIVVKLISKLLEMASYQFSNHGCNDLYEDFWDGVSEDEKQNLYKEFHDWNGDPEDYNPSQIGYLGDSHLMRYFSEKVLEL